MNESAMTVDERFERIETGLARLIEVQNRNADTLGDLMKSVGVYIDSANAHMKDNEARAKDHEARTKRTEDLLDALIRAITADHSNGKGSH